MPDTIDPLDIFRSVTPAESCELHDRFNRPWTDITHCMRAFQADLLAQTISNWSGETMRYMIWAGEMEENAQTQEAVLIIKEVATRMGDDPYAVQARVLEVLKAQVEAAGDYYTFMAYVEYMIRRRTEMDLHWDTFRDITPILEAAEALMQRLPSPELDQKSVEEAEANAEALMTPPTKEEDALGRPLGTTNGQPTST